MPTARRAAGAQTPVAAGSRQRPRLGGRRALAIGQHNFLFDRSQQPHLTSDHLAAQLGVVKTTMANKAALIRKTLNLGAFEPDLTRSATLEQHPLAWLVEVEGFIVDARMLPADLQDEARRRGLIPDLDRRRAVRQTRPAYT